ncbi:hypothetical protein C8J57DRAFT_1679129 [Mycena rebaudengoi]|nr:hypothetical protein C8J57DRAFT_1679129 [Mycena rebaudengoi]
MTVNWTFDTHFHLFVQKLDTWACTRGQVGVSDAFRVKKKECSSKILAGLVTVTKGKATKMEYKRYKPAIVLKYGYELVGWPKDTHFDCPSNLADTNLVNRLFLALTSGKLRWESITDSRRAEVQAERDAEEEEQRKEKVVRKQENSEGVVSSKKRKCIADMTPAELEERAERRREQDKLKKRRKRARERGEDPDAAGNDEEQPKGRDKTTAT